LLQNYDLSVCDTCRYYICTSVVYIQWQ
jgi:hypothetical protein